MPDGSAHDIAPDEVGVLASGDHAAWDELVRTEGHLYQATWWARPLHRYGMGFDVVGCRRHGSVVGGALLRSLKVPRVPWTVVDCLHGPLGVDAGLPVGSFLDEVRAVARRRRAVQVSFRNCPPVAHRALVDALAGRGARVVEASEPAEAVVALEGRSLDEVEAGFRQNARRFVRKAERSGIRVRPVTGPEDLRLAYDAFAASAQRKGFVELRPWEALEPVMRAGIERDQARAYGAFVGGTLAAAIFVSFVGPQAEYLYGGFHAEHARHYPNHLLHRRAISDAIERGCAAYNLGLLGVTRRSEGVNAFKRSFGPDEVSIPTTVHWQVRPHLAGALDRVRAQPQAKALLRRLRASVAAGRAGDDGVSPPTT